MKRKRLIRPMATVVLILALFVIFPGRAKNEWFRAVNVPVRVDVDGADFVLEVCDVLESRYYASDSLNYPEMLNSALRGVSVELGYHGISFIPDTLKDNFTEEQCKDTFAIEFARAKKMAETIEDSIGHTLEFVAAEWLLASLQDSHCYFIYPEVRQQTEDLISQKTLFCGLGGSITQIVDCGDTIFYLNDVFPESPAKKAGLERFDRILKIDSLSTRGMTLDSVITLIKGDCETTVALSLKRMDSVFTVVITRDEIVSPFWSADTIYSGGKMFIDLRLYTFLFDFDTRDTIKNYLSKVQFSADGIVFDLRGNLGGYLSNVHELLGMFLDSSTLEFYNVGHNSKDTSRFIAQGKLPRLYGIQPVAVLIDGGSGSASEIFASVLQENGKALIVGQPSAGAVNISVTPSLSFGSAMSVSICKFFTASNRQLENNPVIPDFPVIYSREGILAGYDSQLEKAVEVLSSAAR